MRAPVRVVSKVRAAVICGIFLGGAFMWTGRLAAGTPVVIKLWDQHVHDKKFRTRIFKDFNAANPDIKVEYTSQITSTYQTMMDAAFRSGSQPDIFVMTGIASLAKLVEMGWVIPLDEVAPSKEALDKFIAMFPASQLPFQDGANMLGGKLYSWPTNGTAGRMMLYFNTRFLREAGLKGADGGPAVPETWDDMRGFTRKITELGQGMVYGMVHGVKNNRDWHLDLFLSVAPAAGWPLVEGFGGPGFDLRTGYYDMHHPAFRGALQLWLDMKNDGSIFPGDISMDVETARFKFAQELAGMIFGGSYIPGGLLAINSELQFDVVLPPTQKRGLRLGFASATPLSSSSEYIVSSRIKSKEAAWKVITFMVSQQYQEEWVKAAGGISVFPQYNKPEFFPHPTMAKVAQMGVTGKKGIPEKPALYDKFIVDYVSPHSELLYPSMEDVWEGIWIGKLGMEAMDDYERRVNKSWDLAFVEANKNGLKISRADFIFPDWDPTKDYIPKSGKK